MFHPQDTECFHHCLLLKRKLVVGLLPSLAASGVREEAGKWAKVHFNWAVFTSHVFVTIRIEVLVKTFHAL